MSSRSGSTSWGVLRTEWFFSRYLSDSCHLLASLLEVSKPAFNSCLGPAWLPAQLGVSLEPFGMVGIVPASFITLIPMCLECSCFSF